METALLVVHVTHLTATWYESLFNQEVIADFAGGRITSDAGGLLLRELDQRYRLAENVARCLQAIDPGFRETLSLLEGDVVQLLSEPFEGKTYSPTYSATQEGKNI
ncbi:MAG: transposase [Thermodesulfobacteriota bacterium]